MTNQVVNVGTIPNDGTGDPARTAFSKINGNFGELYVGLSQGADIASASNTALATSTGEIVQVTGSTTITSFGAVPAGNVMKRVVVFTGTPLLTHNPTSLILPSGGNVQVTAGAVAHLVGTPGSSNWRVASFLQGSTAVGPALALAASVAEAQSTIGLTQLLGNADGIATLDATGTVPLGQLPSSVAQNGFALVAANITASATVTSASISKHYKVNGTGISLDFDLTSGWSLGAAVRFTNIGTSDVIISNGVLGINRSGTNNFTLPPDESVTLRYNQATAPQLIADFLDVSIDLPANTVVVRNNADTDWEARVQKVAYGGAVSAASGQFLPATGSFYVHSPDFSSTLTHVRRTSVGGTCSLQVFESGTAINGFASPVAIGSAGTPASIASTEAVAGGALMRVDWSAGTGTLTAIVATCHGARTGF